MTIIDDKADVLGHPPNPDILNQTGESPVCVGALEAGQMGPRLLRNFTRDSGNQVTLGAFLGTFSNDPTRLATAFELISAGLAFALQQVFTSNAGYFVILRGSTFTVGNRISMGGVRGDVLRLGFIQTTIMEMGQPPSVQGADPAMWVKSRQNRMRGALKRRWPNRNLPGKAAQGSSPTLGFVGTV